MIISTLNEWLNESTEGFLEPTEENLRKFNLDPGKVTINSDGSIDYDGDVKLFSKNLTKLPFRFNKVKGLFSCSENKLVSLEGSPVSVGGSFICHANRLVNLEGAPRSVGGNFTCHDNRLVSLAGGPSSVGGNFDCSYNQLVSLEGSPRSVGGNFRCSLNIILYNPTKHPGSFALNERWYVKDSSGKSKEYSGKKHLEMAFERLEELSYMEVIGIRSGLAKVSLPEDLKEFCQEKIEEYIEKNTNNSFRKGYKELDDDLRDMLF